MIMILWLELELSFVEDFPYRTEVALQQAPEWDKSEDKEWPCSVIISATSIASFVQLLGHAE